MIAVEFCVTDIEGAELAAKHGATRIELCVDLSIGGLTPSFGLIEACSDLIETHVLIRPRGGNFVFNESELAIMRADILQAHLAGATGIVFGCLDEKNGLHHSANESMLALAEQLELETTFHRAFDFVNNPIESLNQLTDWGIKRILTNKIEIMAGGGVHPMNAKELLETGIHALHCSIHKAKVASNNMGAKIEYDLEKIIGMIEFQV